MAQHLIESVVEIFALRGATLLITEPTSGVMMSLASHGSTTRPSSERPFLVPLDDPGVQLLRHRHSPVTEHEINARSSSLGQRMAELGTVAASPLLAHNKLVGSLLIGPKVSGAQPSAEELELLQLLSRHTATVFENVRLFQSATYEGLTGLLRREAILEKLKLELRRAQRYGRPLTVGIADLDRFKQVNDRFGHLAGDLVLKRVAQTLSNSLRTSDWLGRLGGEEFLFLLPETDLEDSFPVAEKLRLAVEDLLVELDEPDTVEITISIGLASVSELPAEPPATPSDLIAVADRTLYRAQTSGRNLIEPQHAAIACPRGSRMSRQPEPYPSEIRRLPEENRLRVLWEDGHVSHYDYGYLRGFCPCAVCQGHDNAAVVFHPPPSQVTPSSIEPVGNYGISILWSDGHATGIYRFDFLRDLCPCETCTSTPA